MRTLAILSVLLLAGWAAAQPSGPASPPATGPGTSATNPGASSGSGTAPRGPQTAVDEEMLEGAARDAGRTEEDRIYVPGAAGVPESLPLPAPMPGVPGPAQGAPGEGPAETAPRDRTLRPGG